MTTAVPGTPFASAAAQRLAAITHTRSDSSYSVPGQRLSPRLPRLAAAAVPGAA